MAWWRGAKDWVVEKAAPRLLNQGAIKPYGKMTSLKLDSKTKRLELELELKGEQEPISVQIPHYELLPDGEQTVVLFEDVLTSREWLTVLARRFVVGKRIPLPKELDAILKSVL